MRTEEKAEELEKESESAAETENSDAVSDSSLDVAAEFEQSDKSANEFSKNLESDLKESDEKTEKNNDENEQKFSHADESADEKKKADKNLENFNGVFECALTTVDNPFDPLTQFDDWFRYDEEKGYHSCAYLARIAQINDEMSDEEVLQNIENAIDEIVKYDFMNIYKKVKRPTDE